MQKASVLLGVGCVLLLSVSVQGQTNLTANITNDQEPAAGTPPVPVTPTTSAGAPRQSSGTATFTLSPAMDSIALKFIAPARRAAWVDATIALK